MTVLCLATAYLLGSIPWGLWIGRLRGVDVRRHGSGNIGATNVGRILGRNTGILVLLLDALKGAIPVVLARSLQAAAPEALAFLPAASGTAAILGHITTPWAGFRGGKGVATGAGAAAVLTPIPFAIAMVVFLAILGGLRIVSLGSVLAAIALAVSVFFFSFHGPEGVWLLGWSLLVAVLVLLRHTANMKRLFTGNEPRLGAKSGRERRRGAHS